MNTLPNTASPGSAALHTHHTYTLFEAIASGGMANIHLARQVGPRGLSRIVAVKKLHARCARDAEFVSMFRDEIRLASRVIHPNVVPILDVLTAEDELLLVMEYVHGESVSRLLRSCPQAIPARIACTIIVGVLHGLHAAHQARSERGEPLHIIHRDVTPQNIVVGVDGTARLLDFGIAHAVGRMQTTRLGQVKGKLAYMAPEQLRGRVLDRKVDIYAAAVSLWEMLTGRKVFEGRDPDKVAQMVLHKPVGPPSLFEPKISAALDAIVLRGLHREPQRRFPTARDMAIALEQETEIVSATVLGDWVNEVWGVARAVRDRQLWDMETAEGTAYLVRPVSPPGERPRIPDDRERYEGHKRGPSAEVDEPTLGSAVSTVPLAPLLEDDFAQVTTPDFGARDYAVGVQRIEPLPSARSRSWFSVQRVVPVVLAVAASVLIVEMPAYVGREDAVTKAVPSRIPATPSPRPAAIERLPPIATEGAPPGKDAVSLPPSSAAAVPPGAPLPQCASPASTPATLAAGPTLPPRASLQRRAPRWPADLRHAPGRSAPRTVRQPGARAAASRPQMRTADDCAPPFVIDAAGIKHFKLACL